MGSLQGPVEFFFEIRPFEKGRGLVLLSLRGRARPRPLGPDSLLVSNRL
jgi:hypothetical protein